MAEENETFEENVEFVETLKINNANRFGTTVSQSEIGLFGLTGTSQEILLSDKSGKLPVSANQTVTVFENDTSFDFGTVLLAVSQENKNVAFFAEKDGKITLNVDQTYFDTLTAGNPAFDQLKIKADETSSLYSLPVSNLRLSQDLNIEDIQIAGTDGQNYAINFSALGCQLHSGDAKIAKANSIAPFDIAISQEFLSSALEEKNGCTIGKGALDRSNDKLINSLVILTLRNLRANTKKSVVDAKLGNIKLTSMRLGKDGQWADIMQKDGKSFVYLHAKGTSSRSLRAPKWYQIDHVSIEQGKNEEYQLSFGLGKGDGESAKIGLDMSKKMSVDRVQKLQTLLSEEFEKTRSIETNVSVKERSKSFDGSFQKHKFAIYQASKEGTYTVADENVATISKNVEGSSDDDSGDISPAPQETPAANIVAENLDTQNETPAESKEEKPKEEEKPQEEKKKEEKKKAKPKATKAKKKDGLLKKLSKLKMVGPIFAITLVLSALVPFLAPVAAVLLGVWGINNTGFADAFKPGKPRLSKQEKTEMDLEQQETKVLAKRNEKTAKKQKELKDEVTKLSKEHNNLVKQLESEKDDAKRQQMELKVAKAKEDYQTAVAKLKDFNEKVEKGEDEFTEEFNKEIANIKRSREMIASATSEKNIKSLEKSGTALTDYTLSEEAVAKYESLSPEEKERLKKKREGKFSFFGRGRSK